MLFLRCVYLGSNKVITRKIQIDEEIGCVNTLLDSKKAIFLSILKTYAKIWNCAKF
jgi:hypothetical protein